MLLPLSHGTCNRARSPAAIERRAEVRHLQRRLRESNPRPLWGSRFRDGFLDQPGSLQAAAARNDRALARSKRAVRTFTLHRNTKQAERRIERRPTRFRASRATTTPGANKLAIPCELRRLGSNQRKTRLTDARNYQQLPLRNKSARPDLNRRSPAPKAGAMPSFATRWRKRPPGVEPGLPPWQGSRLPLHHGRVRLVEFTKNEQ